MKTNVFADLDFSDRTEKRARTEAFEFDVPQAGVVVVTNTGHDSSHAVNVSDGVPTGCSCPADTYQSGACKHRVAVAMADPVLEAASASRGKRAIADGGVVLAPKTRGESPENTHADGCDDPDCEGIDADADRPVLSWECWGCWAAYSEEDLIEASADE